jgi:hypothetical protein
MIREEIACARPLSEFRDTGVQRTENRLTHIVDTRISRCAFSDRRVVTRRGHVEETCVLALIHEGKGLQIPVDCFLEVPAGNQRLFQFSLEKILRPGGHAALGGGLHHIAYMHSSPLQMDSANWVMQEMVLN